MHFRPFSMFPRLASLLFFIATATALVLRTTPNSDRLIPRDVWQFPNGTWVENLAVRPNGYLLVTLLNVPELYLVDPAGVQPAQLVYQFPNATALTGITEVETDVFVVIAGNWSLKTFSSTPGSYSAWRVDFSSNTPPSGANITKISDISEAAFLNGLTTLDNDGNVLIADSVAGVVWRLDTHSGQYQLAIDDPLMKPVKGPLVLGINGLHIRDSILYFTNTFNFTFNRVPIYSNGTATGPAEVFAQSGLVDDFTFDKEGNAFVTQDPANALEEITPEGAVKVLVGSLNSTELVGPTAAQFGRTSLDASTLYISTNGGLAAPVKGTPIIGGKVVAVQLQNPY